MPGYIDNYARPDNPVTDITGRPLNVVLRFADAGAATPSDHPLAGFAGLLNVPPSLLGLLGVPLSGIGDDFWSRNRGSDGRTQRERTASQIQAEIAKAVAGIGAQATDIHVALPQTGTLQALLLSGSLANREASQLILLSYQLARLAADFTVVLPRSGNPIVGVLQNVLPDPTLRLVFDVELLIQVFVPRAPGPFPASASFSTLDADIQTTNATATIGVAILDGIGFLTGQPGNIFQAAEGAVDGSANASGDIGAFVDLLSQIGAVWPLASGLLGFKTVEAYFDAAPALGLRFVHPQDPPPTVVNAADSPFPSLFHPVLETDATRVRAGDGVSAIGSFFPLDQAAQLLIGWNDTTSGAVRQSVIRWGRLGGPQRVDVKARAAADNQNFFVARPLAAGTTYSFAVQDADLLTETPFSDTLELKTQATDALVLALAPLGGGPRMVVSTFTLAGNGAFMQPFTVPATLASGSYVLSAELAGQVLASTGLKVVSGGDSFPPLLEALDPATRAVVHGVEEGGSVQLHGTGFGAGPVQITVDSESGQTLATAAADANGEFRQSVQWPVGVVGPHSALARQPGGGKVLTASTDLFIQPIPR